MRLFSAMPQVLVKRDMERIYTSALRILAETPLRTDGTEEFNDALSAFGCRVAAGKIHFPQSVIDKLLDRIAAERQLEEDAEAGQERRTLTPHVSGQGSLICATHDDTLRAAKTDDLAQLARFMDALPGEVGWKHPMIIPADRPLRTREIHAFATICMNHSKPSRVSPYSPRAVQSMYEILKVCLGSDEEVRKHHHLIAHKLWINTPFMLGRESIEGALLSRKLLGHPLGLTMMPVAGAATPITAPGCLALVTAEVLAGNIVTLALDDKMAGYPSSPLTMDMRQGAHAEQDAYADLLRIGANQMRRFIFGGPANLGAFGLRTAAKTPGAQAMMEKTLGGMLSLWCGGGALSSVGTLAYADAASMVQLVLDLELAGYLNRLARGLRCDEDDLLAEAVNLTTAAQGARYLEHEHTLRHFRQEQWLTELCDRRVAQAWMQDPVSMVDRARRQAIEIADGAENRCPLDAGQKQQIQELLAEADALDEADMKQQR